jgi:flagellar assembly factor FliW
VLVRLQGDGDFRSAECVEMLKEADIVVTNPPFSLFREYVVQLKEYNKKFLIIGNKNVITYKEIFK